MFFKLSFSASKIALPMTSTTWGTTAFPSARSRATLLGSPSFRARTPGKVIQSILVILPKSDPEESCPLHHVGSHSSSCCPNSPLLCGPVMLVLGTTTQPLSANSIRPISQPFLGRSSNWHEESVKVSLHIYLSI